MRPTHRLLIAGAFLLAALVAHAGGQQARVDPAQLMRDVEVLAADGMEGRLVGTPGSARARAYIVRRFREAGIRPAGASYEHPFTFKRAGRAGTQQGVNVLGVVRGVRTPARYLVVTAHYDHLGVRDGRVYNGANDNATGVAALLAIGAHFSRNGQAHSLLLAALDAEEGGLHGAHELVSRGPVPRSAMALNVNIDMIGRDAGNVLYAAGTHHYPFLEPYLQGVAQPPVALRLGHDSPNGAGDWTKDSDHYAFHRARIPFLYFGVEDGAHHHKTTDDAESIQKAFLAGAAATIIAVLERLDADL